MLFPPVNPSTFLDLSFIEEVQSLELCSLFWKESETCENDDDGDQEEKRVKQGYYREEGSKAVTFHKKGNLSQNRKRTAAFLLKSTY